MKHGKRLMAVGIMTVAGLVTAWHVKGQSSMLFPLIAPKWPQEATQGWIYPGAQHTPGIVSYVDMQNLTEKEKPELYAVSLTTSDSIDKVWKFYDAKSNTNNCHIWSSSEQCTKVAQQDAQGRGISSAILVPQHKSNVGLIVVQQTHSNITVQISRDPNKSKVTNIMLVVNFH